MSRRYGRAIAAGLASCHALCCAGAPAPCASTNCGAGRECLANTCMPVGAEPVPKDTTRIVLEPSSIATAGPEDAIAGEVAFGRDEAAALYLRFDSAWKHEGAVTRAFLLLEPAEEPRAASTDFPLDVWTVRAPWSPDRIARGVRPTLGPPRARGLLHPPATVRIDVTSVAMELAGKPDDDGLAVTAGRRGPLALGVRTGASGGAPRLELYVRAPR